MSWSHNKKRFSAPKKKRKKDAGRDREQWLGHLAFTSEGVVTLPISSSFLSIMATENRSESAACSQQTNSQVQNGTAGNNEQQNGQPQQQQQQGSIWKGLLFRMFIFWMISNLFRGRQQSSNTNTVASTNMFKTDQKIVSLSYMFLQRWLLGFLFEKICWFVWSVVFIGEFLWTSY